MNYWKKERMKEIVKHVGVLLLILAACTGIAFGIIKYYDQFYSEREIKTVVVVDKEDDVHHSVVMTGKVLVPVTTHTYYLYGKNNVTLKVSQSIFDKINAGDKVQVEYIYIYYKKDHSLYKIEYNYIGE